MSNKFTAIDNLSNEVKKTESMITGIMLLIELSKRVIKQETPEQEKQLKEIAKDYLDFDEDRVSSIYELGFIRLFAVLESFMCDYLRELYKKFPNSLPDKKLELSAIWDLGSQEDIRDFIIDHVSIENSYEMSIWEKTLSNTFGIKVFNDSEEEKMFFLVNILRNISMHSNGKWNSKVYRECKAFLNGNKKNLDNTKRERFEISKFEIKDEQKYELLMKVIQRLINNLTQNTPLPI